MPFDDLPDNIDLFDQHEAERERLLDKLPRCSECDKPIQGDFLFEFNDELICPNCLKDNHRKWVEDYIE